MKNLIPHFIVDQYEKKKFQGSFIAYTMFVDVSVFTHLTEIIMAHKKDDAEILTEILNDIFRPIVKKLYENGGFIANFAGDAFTAIFTDKSQKELNHFLQTVSFIIDSFKNKKKISTKYGDFEMGIKIGLSYGRLDWGILGENGKYSYYFKGESIDGCAKSEHKSQTNEIICDSRLLTKIESQFQDLSQIFEYISYLDLMLPPKAVKYYKLDFKDNLNLAKQNLLVKRNIKAKVLKKFMLDAVVNFKKKAEFREIISCFVAFKEPSTLDELNNFITKVIENAYAYGGYFNKIDFGDKGNVFLVVFGAPISYENNLERALDFSLKLKTFGNIDLKIGLTFGYAYAGIMGGECRCEYTVIGDNVNLASRLMVRTEWNKIWTSKRIAKQMKEKYVFDVAGEFVFKGKEGLVSVYEFKSKKKFSSLFKGDIVGRRKELKKLKTFIAPIFKQKFSGIFYVYGEAGIGKSRLMDAFKKELKIRTFSFPCEQILQKSFNPVLYFLRKYFDISNKESFDKKFDKLIDLLEKKDSMKCIKEELLRTKSVIAGYLGIEWKNSLFEELEPQKRYENFMYGVKSLIKAESLITPLIIILEDVHWIDNDSKFFIEMLVRNIEDFPIAIIATSRYLPGGNKFEFESEFAMNEINLDFLERKYLPEYSKIILKTDDKISKDLLDLIYNKTSGNPFFIEQIILDLQDKGVIQKHELTKELFVNIKDFEKIPNNIQSVIISRLDSLPNELRNIIQTASIIGRKFDAKILKQIFDDDNNEDDNNFYEKLELIENENIWIPLSQGNYIFRHILFRDVAYDMQLRSRLKKFHGLIAKTYELLFADDLKKYYADIAHHYNKSNKVEKTIEYLEKAGDFAKSNYRNEAAIEFYNLLLDKNKLGFGHQIEVLFKKADILELIGKRKESEKIYRECLKLSKEEKNTFYLAKSSRFVGWQLINNGDYQEAKSFLLESLELYKAIDDKLGVGTVLNDMGMIYHQTGKYDKAEEFYKQSLLIAKEYDAKYLASRAFCNIGIIYFKNGEYDKALDSHRESLKLLDSAKDQYRIAITIGNMGDVYSDKGDYKKAIEYYEENLRISQRMGDKDGISSTVSNIGVLYHQQGNFLQAEKYYLEGQRLFKELGDKHGMNRIIGNMGILYKTLGNYEKAMEYYKKYLAICQEMDDTVGMAGAFINIGNIYRDQNNYDKAMNFYKKALPIYEKINSKWEISSVFGNMGIIYKRLGNYKKAMEYYNKNLKISKEIGDKRSISMVIGNIGSVYLNQGFYSKALEAYEQQIEICKEIDYKRGISIVVGNIGNLYYRQKKYKKALLQYDKALEICFEINFVNNNPEWFNGKAKCLYKLGEYKKSQISNRDCLDGAEEMKNMNFIFLSKILSEMNKFVLAKTETDKKEIVAKLKALLKNETDNLKRIYLKYKIFFMLKELNQYNTEYKEELISEYEKLYKQTSDIEYRYKIEKLENN